MVKFVRCAGSRVCGGGTWEREWKWVRGGAGVERVRMGGGDARGLRAPREQKRAALSPGGAQKQECHLPKQASGITKKEDEALATSRSSTRVSHG